MCPPRKFRAAESMVVDLGGGDTASAHDRAFIIKAERRMLHRDTTSSRSAWDPHVLADVSDAAMVGVTNASLLTAYYLARHQRFRGVGSPRWGGGARSALVWPNGTKNPPTRLDDVAEAFELFTSPVSGQPSASGGEASEWHHVDTLISPPDAAVYSSMLWEHQPELIIEIGTECGGSAIFFASIMRMYNPSRAKVLTYDVRRTYHRCSAIHASGRKMWKGYRSALWKQYIEEGLLEARIADVSTAAEQAYVARRVAAARTVWVFDDGDHFATPLLVHFHLLARHVSPGGYYLIADTRLERTCRSAWFAMRSRTEYCLKILSLEGGPGRAVHYLQRQSPMLVAGVFAVDRTPERYVLTQHPGGWLRRANTSSHQK